MAEEISTLTNRDCQLSENNRTLSNWSRWHNSSRFSEHPAWVVVARDKKHFRTNTQMSGGNTKFRTGKTKFGAGNTKLGFWNFYDAREVI